MMTGFREQGSGIPLMLLHGISSGAASWHKQMALNGFRVLAWTCRAMAKARCWP
ncbi:alpha/beta fold hydrolase [Enterobacter hormaechei]